MDNQKPDLNAPTGDEFRLYRNTAAAHVRIEILRDGETLAALEMPDDKFEQAFSHYLEHARTKQ